MLQLATLIFMMLVTVLKIQMRYVLIVWVIVNI